MKKIFLATLFIFVSNTNAHNLVRGSDSWNRFYTPGQTSNFVRSAIKHRLKTSSTDKAYTCVLKVHGIEREVFGVKSQHELTYLYNSLRLLSPSELKQVPPYAILDRMSTTGGSSFRKDKPQSEFIAINRLNFPRAKIVNERLRPASPNTRIKNLFMIEKSQEVTEQKRIAVATVLHEAGHFLGYNKELPRVDFTGNDKTQLGLWWKNYNYCPRCRTRGVGEAQAQFTSHLLRYRPYNEASHLFCNNKCRSYLARKNQKFLLSKEFVDTLLESVFTYREQMDKRLNRSRRELTSPSQWDENLPNFPKDCSGAQ